MSRNYASSIYKADNNRGYNPIDNDRRGSPCPLKQVMLKPKASRKIAWDST